VTSSQKVPQHRAVDTRKPHIQKNQKARASDEKGRGGTTPREKQSPNQNKKTASHGEKKWNGRGPEKGATERFLQDCLLRPRSPRCRVKKWRKHRGPVQEKNSNTRGEQKLGRGRGFLRRRGYLFLARNCTQLKRGARLPQKKKRRLPRPSGTKTAAKRTEASEILKKGKRGREKGRQKGPRSLHQRFREWGGSCVPNGQHGRKKQDRSYEGEGKKTLTVTGGHPAK